jgi:hypothetical protein
MLKLWLLMKRGSNGLLKQCCKEAPKYMQRPKTKTG